ncbi:integrase core domain-containing protein [Burkholderia territorii]|uniref:integrase core domain-containing protein n=1 Tax=Burkholderia territorii TaxID=1503055 RepID=UPI002ED8D1FA
MGTPILATRNGDAISQKQGFKIAESIPPRRIDIARQLLTDNGSAFRSHEFARACQELGIRHKFTRAYRPQTNGKAERFIQSALREWAYAWTYQSSAHRIEALASWQHHYNWHRSHSAIGGIAPMARLPASRNNLLTLHS